MQDRKKVCRNVRHGVMVQCHLTPASTWRQSFRVQGPPGHGQPQSMHQDRVAYEGLLGLVAARLDILT